MTKTTTIRISITMKQWLDKIKKVFNKKNGAGITYNEILNKFKKGEKIET